MNKISEKYLISKNDNPKGLNCISALFYLLGFDGKEIPHNMEDFLEIKNKCKKVNSIQEADIIYLPYPTEHFMIIDPSDKDYIIHRNGLNENLIRQELSLFTRTLYPGPDGEIDLIYYKLN